MPKKTRNVCPSDFVTVFPSESALKKSEKEVVALRILFIKYLEGDKWDPISPETYHSYLGRSFEGDGCVENNFKELELLCSNYGLYSIEFKRGLIKPHWEFLWFTELNEILNSPEEVGRIHPAWEKIRICKENESA